MILPTGKYIIRGSLAFPVSQGSCNSIAKMDSKEKLLKKIKKKNKIRKLEVFFLEGEFPYTPKTTTSLHPDLHSLEAMININEKLFSPSRVPQRWCFASFKSSEKGNKIAQVWKDFKGRCNINKGLVYLAPAVHVLTL